MDLFTYGTLMWPQIMRAVTGTDPRSERARLHDHARYRVKGEDFPGAIRIRGESIDGRIYRGLSGTTVRVLDDFEGLLYRRRTVFVHTEAGKRQRAAVYLVRNATLLSSEHWDSDEFRDRHMSRWLRALGRGAGSVPR